MPSDIPDEELQRAVRRAVRAELDRLAGRLFWTVVSLVGIYAGFGLVTMGFNAAGWNVVTVAFVVLGIALIGQGIRTLLLKWWPDDLDTA
jgi:fatty acid desaturase